MASTKSLLFEKGSVSAATANKIIVWKIQENMSWTFLNKLFKAGSQQIAWFRRTSSSQRSRGALGRLESPFEDVNVFEKGCGNSKCLVTQAADAAGISIDLTGAVGQKDCSSWYETERTRASSPNGVCIVWVATCGFHQWENDTRNHGWFCNYYVIYCHWEH